MPKFKFEDPMKDPGFPRSLSMPISSEEDKEIWLAIDSLAKEQRVSNSSIVRTMLRYALEAYSEHSKKIG